MQGLARLRAGRHSSAHATDTLCRVVVTPADLLPLAGPGISDLLHERSPPRRFRSPGRPHRLDLGSAGPGVRLRYRPHVDIARLDLGVDQPLSDDLPAQRQLLACRRPGPSEVRMPESISQVKERDDGSGRCAAAGSCQRAVCDTGPGSYTRRLVVSEGTDRKNRVGGQWYAHRRSGFARSAASSL